MSSSLPVVVIILSALILLGILAVIMIWKKRREGKPVEIDYYAFFVMGISFLPLGIVLMLLINPGFIGLAGLADLYHHRALPPGEMEADKNGIIHRPHAHGYWL